MKLIKVIKSDAKIQDVNLFDKQFYSIYKDVKDMKAKVKSKEANLYSVIDKLLDSIAEDTRNQEKAPFDLDAESPYQKFDKAIKAKRTLMDHLTFMMKELKTI